MGEKKKKKKNLPKTTSKIFAKMPKWQSLDSGFLGNVWQFSKGEKDKPWPLNAIEQDKGVNLLQKLESLETLNFYQNLPDHHKIKVESLCKAARDEISKNARLRNYGLDEVFSIRLTGQKRLVAMPHRIPVDENSYYQLFSFIWFDPNHEICESRKKHT